MSHQGEIPDWRADDFGLIETLLWTRDEGFHLFAEHLSRLGASSTSLGFAFDEARVRAALAAAADGEKGERLRVRLVLARDGALETSATAIEPVPRNAAWKVAFARQRFSSADPLLRHKTTRRDLYEGELAEAAARCGADEVIFLNERGELCEGARCNLFLAQGGLLLTPPLSCGLLPGTLRAHLLESGRAREKILRPADLSGVVEFYMGNCVRGLVRSTLAEDMK
jgi:branched-subunit amino acid aminotransferase/4-amino-4-deoxychorismate lyase